MFRSLFMAALIFMVLARPCVAQAQTASATSTDQSQVSPPASGEANAKNVAPKKVWTNDNLAETSGKISVVGDKRNPKYTSTPVKPADPATVSRIRESLQKLGAQLEYVNRQLTSFKEFQEGETVSKGSDEIKQGYTRMPVNQQITVLQGKKKKLETQIDALFDEARIKGIEPGQLR